MRQAFRSAGIRVREEPDIAGWLAVHFIANAGIHAQGLRLGTLSRLAGDTAGLREALFTSGELLPMLSARGIDLDRHRGLTFAFRHPRLLAPVLGWATRHIAAARISLEAQSDPRAEEPRAVCRDALAAARESGVPVPRLEAAADLFAA